MKFLTRLIAAAQAAKEELFPPRQTIEVEFMIQELTNVETGLPALLVYASAGERSFCFLEGQFAAIGIQDQAEVKSWALADAPPYEGELPPL